MPGIGEALDDRRRREPLQQQLAGVAQWSYGFGKDFEK
jgi:hypothetical protein